MAGNWDSPLSVHTSDLYENNPHTHHPAQHINTRKESENTHTPLIRRSGFKYPLTHHHPPHSTLGLNLFCNRDGGWPAEAGVPSSTLLSRSTPPLLPLSSHLLSGEELGLRTLKAGPQEPSCALGWSQTLSSALACHAATGRPLYPSANICARKLLAGSSLHVKPPRGERRPPQSPWGKGEGAKIGGPCVREKPPCKATQGERSPHTGPLGVEERRLHAGPGGCLLKEPWRGQSRFRGQGVPRVSPTSLQLNRGRLHYFQHHLVPGMTSACYRRALPGWTGPVLGTTTSLRGPDTPRGEADRAQLSDPETTTKHKTRYSSL